MLHNTAQAVLLVIMMVHFCAAVDLRALLTVHLNVCFMATRDCEWVSKLTSDETNSLLRPRRSSFS
jgi:hypothetical protein